MVRFLLFLLLAVVLTGCSVVGGGEPEVREVSSEQLQAMVLPLSDFGPEYSASVVDRESGEKGPYEIIEWAGDPADEAADVARFGHLKRYIGAFGSNQAVIRGTGAFYLASSVTSHRERAGAIGDLTDQFADLQRMLSGTTEMGSLQSFERFNVSAGEQAYGVSVRLVGSGSMFGLRGPVTLTITAAALQRGPIVGQVMMMRLDADDVELEVAELARRLDRRIAMVLGGGWPPPGEVSGPLASEGSPPQSLP